MSFRLRVIAAIAAVEALLLVILFGTALGMIQKLGEVEVRHDADNYTRLAASILRNPLSRDDGPTVRALAAELVRNADAAAVEIRDAHGRLLASAASERTPGRALTFTRPISEPGAEPVGSITLKIRNDWLDDALTTAGLKIGGIAFLLLIVSAGVSYVLGSYLTRQLVVLRQAAASVAAGDLDIHVPERGPPEFISVARAMNMMSRRVAGLNAEKDQALARRTLELSSTFQSMSEGVAIFNDAGILMASNAAFADQIGFEVKLMRPGISLDALVDLHMAQAGGHEDPNAIALARECRAIEWPGASLRFEVPFPDGRIVAVQRTRLPTGGFIAIHQDVTRQREDQRRVLHAAKLTTLGELATSVAHELSQPLNVIRLAADNARVKVEDGRATSEYLAEKLKRIAHQTGRATNIIDHMRIFGRKPAEEAESFDLSRAVEGAAGFFIETARLKGYRLDFDIEPNVTIHGHAILIEQVVANLISNAMSAFESQDGNAHPAIGVRVTIAGNHAVVTVVDNAGGIKAEVLLRVFEPFFTTKPAGKGTGLGLSVSFGIVRDMGGKIEAYNVGGGALFRIEIPLSEGRVAIGTGAVVVVGDQAKSAALAS